MLFAGKTKSGSNHLWPRWWVFLFGGLVTLLYQELEDTIVSDGMNGIR